MEKEVIGYCPVCSHKLIATKLSCKNCELDLAGDFSLSKFSYLSKEEQEFAALFLSNEGSFKDVQGSLNITYQKAKQTLADIQVKLQLRNEDEGNRDMGSCEHKYSSVAINDDDHFVVKLIKEKLNACGGRAVIPLITAGKEAEIWFDKDEKGLVCDKIPVPNQLNWDAFKAAYSIAAAQDGTAYKGYARAGKLGSDKLPKHSLEGFVALAVHGVPEGGSAFSPGFIIAAVLDWAGVMINERGSTVKLTPIAHVGSYEEALINAGTFINGLDDSTAIQEKLGFFRHWYYFEELDGFAPSKFIGYKNMNIRAYEIGTAEGPLDGRETEHTLTKIFKAVEGGLKEELYTKLKDFLAEYGKQPNKLANIHIKK